MSILKSEYIRGVFSENFFKSLGQSMGWGLGGASVLVICGTTIGLVDKLFSNDGCQPYMVSNNYICECHTKSLIDNPAHQVELINHDNGDMDGEIDDNDNENEN